MGTDTGAAAVYVLDTAREWGQLHYGRGRKTKNTWGGWETINKQLGVIGDVRCRRWEASSLSLVGKVC